VSVKPARSALCVGLFVAAQFAGAQLGVFSQAQAQDADAALKEYSAVLEQIQNVKLATMQREVMMEQQKADIENLRTQIQGVPATKSAVRGVVTEMVAEIAKVIESDLPFRKDEREARLGRLQSLLADESTSDVDLFRRAMTIYDVEANYGYTISAYTGDHPKTPGRRLKACVEDTSSSACNLSTEQRKHLADGGKLELDVDSREGFRWSKEADDWEPLAPGDILNARRSVRIARGESAPSVVTAPIKVQAAQ